MNSPKLKPYLDRLHPSAVFATAKGVFDDISDEMYSAATEWRRPDISELIEKVVARLQVVVDTGPRLLLDLRGYLLETNPPLANSALEGMIWAVDERSAASEKETEELLCRLTCAEDAIIFANPIDAKLAVIRTFASHSKVMIARRDLYEDDFGVRLEQLFHLYSSRILEVGASNRTTVSDYLRTGSHQVGLVWFTVYRYMNLEPTLSRSEFAEFREHASEYGYPLLCDLDLAPIRVLSSYLSGSIPSVSEYVNWGYDLILLSGAQLIGGPNCGIVLGRSKIISEIREMRIANFLTPHRVDLTGLYKTLQIHLQPEEAKMQIPILKTLTTSQANLRNRAERLIPQLNNNPLIQSVDCVDGHSFLYERFSLGAVPTCLIRIKPEGKTSAQFDRMLQEMNPGLLTQTDSEYIILDLRALDPVYDSQLPDILQSLAPVASAPVPTSFSADPSSTDSANT